MTNENQKTEATNREIDRVPSQLPCSHGITAEELRDLLHHIGEATQMLDDNYPRWNEEGRRHAVRMATIAVKDAYKLGSYYLMRMKSANVEARREA
jgi:hypothetical protein